MSLNLLGKYLCQLLYVNTYGFLDFRKLQFLIDEHQLICVKW